MRSAETVPRPLRLALERGVLNPPGRSQLHGEHHWKCVAIAGLWIAARTPGADIGFVLTFAAIHDVMRKHDGHDPAHGERAADLLAEIIVDPRWSPCWLGPQDVDAMIFALRAHSEGAASCDPSIGVCWDADRVQLWRVGQRPNPRLLSTPPGARAISLGRELCRRRSLSWAEILDHADDQSDQAECPLWSCAHRGPTCA